MISEAYIYEAIRTPRGKAKNGALHGVKPVTMLTDLIHEILDRNPGLDPVLVEDIVVGCVTPVGDQGANIARTAAIASGLPDAAGAGIQINRFCASGAGGRQPDRGRRSAPAGSRWRSPVASSA